MGLKYKVLGRPYVKKNNQKVATKRKPNGATYSIKYNTPQYNKWHASAMEQLSLQKIPPHPISKPVNLKCTFYMPDKGRVDLSALYEGIQDTLVEVKVLEDDNFKIVAGHDGSRVKIDKHHPRMEIEITPMEGKLYEENNDAQDSDDQTNF